MYKKALIAALISCMTVSAAGCQMNSTKTDTIPDSTADINAAPTAEPAEGESWTEPVVLVKGESTRLPLPANFKGEIRRRQPEKVSAKRRRNGRGTHSRLCLCRTSFKNRTRRNHYCS